MEEEKTKKKIDVPFIVMIAAAILIAAGAILIVTGNNKSLIGNDDKKETEEKKTDEPQEPPKRSIPKAMSNEEALTILRNEKDTNHNTESWAINNVTSVEAGDGNTYLVKYEEITAEGIIDYKQTIIFDNNGVYTIELPGWHEGERDLTQYHFGEEPVEQPVEDTPDEEMTEEELDEASRMAYELIEEQGTTG